jgi:membrane dipeptidase
MIRWDAHVCLPQPPGASFEPVAQLHAAGVQYASLNVGADMNPLSGVVCVSGLSWFLGSHAPAATDVPRHAAYLADVAGIDHVGIGTDICVSQPELDDTPPGEFDPSYWWPASAGYSKESPPAFVAPGMWRALAAELRKTGMTDAEAAQVMGGNMLRVARQTWKA